MFDVEVDCGQPVALLKAQLQSLTGVPPERQKLSGLKGGMLRDDADLAALGLQDGQKCMMMGTADPVPQAPAEKIKFLEDMTSEEKVKEFLPSGLVNLGNTCYLNSALQTMRVVPEMWQDLKGYTFGGGLPEEQTVAALRALHTQMAGTPEAVSPALFVTVFRQHYPQFDQMVGGGHAQQDAEEAWSQMLTAIAQAARQGEANPVTRLFGGEMSVTYKCAEVDDEPAEARRETFRSLKCHINNQTTSLELGLTESMGEKITKASPTLARDAVYLKDCKLESLPEYLSVHLVRFYYKADVKKKAKVVRPVSFPMTLDLYTLCSDEAKKRLEKGRALLAARRDREVERRRNAGPLGGQPLAPEPVDPMEEEHFAALGNKTGWYELCGVITHKGRDADGGHYVAWVKHKGEWLLFDDSSVQVVREEKVKEAYGGAADNHLAYLLLYRSRIPSSDGKSTSPCGPP